MLTAFGASVAMFMLVMYAFERRAALDHDAHEEPPRREAPSATSAL